MSQILGICIMSGLGSVSPDDRKKFATFMEGGLKILQEIDNLKDDLKDVTKALAEEFGLAPTKLSTALRTVFKNSLADKKEEMDIVEEIIQHSGHG
jgi:hypothetical protein